MNAIGMVFTFSGPISERYSDKRSKQVLGHGIEVIGRGIAQALSRFETENLKLGKGILSIFILSPHAKSPVVVPLTRNYAAARQSAKKTVILIDQRKTNPVSSNLKDRIP